MSERQRFLSEAERRILLALARAAVPGGRIFGGANEQTVAKIENFAHRLGPVAQRGLKGGLWTLELGAVARFGKRFSKLSAEQRLAALEAWHQNEFTRQWLRALLVPVRSAYFNDPEIFKQAGCRYAVEPPAQEEQFRWQQNISDATQTLEHDEEMECDVVVVGTGAGGAPVAKELAERGFAVLMLEEGGHFTRKDFNGRPLEMQRKMYRDGGFTVALGNSFFPIPVGKTVGGSTTINSGTCFRLPHSTLEHWRKDLGLAEFTPEYMEPYYRKVEEVLQVEEAKMKYVGKPGEVIARGCDALGYKHAPLKRNAPECDGQGLCCFGCPTDAKRSTNVSYVPEALKSAAQLLTGVKVDQIILNGDKAAGVRAVVTNRSGKRVRLTVRAKAVVLSCGTFYTPTLLLQNGLANGSGELGKNLTIHPACQAFALFDEEIGGWNTIPQGYSIEEFKEEGIMFEGATAPFEVCASALNIYGSRFTEIIENFNRVSAFGYMVKDSSRGRVRVGPGGRPLLTYWMNDTDLRKMRRGMEILARVYFAAGAKEVYPGLWGHEILRSLEDVERMARADVAVRHFDVTAYHPLGTCRMGLSPRSSVVSPANETHDVRNLFVCDGSAVPSSLGVNPQVTIMALSTRAAEFIARKLERSYSAHAAA